MEHGHPLNRRGHETLWNVYREQTKQSTVLRLAVVLLWSVQSLVGQIHYCRSSDHWYGRSTGHPLRRAGAQRMGPLRRRACLLGRSIGTRLLLTTVADNWVPCRYMARSSQFSFSSCHSGASAVTGAVACSSWTMENGCRCQ